MIWSTCSCLGTDQFSVPSFAAESHSAKHSCERHASELAQVGIRVRQLREESRILGPELEVGDSGLDQLFHSTA